MGGSGSSVPIPDPFRSPGAFISEERNLGLFSSTALGVAVMDSSWDYGQLTRPPFDDSALDDFYRLQRQVLIENLVGAGIYNEAEVAQLAFRGRYYTNPELGQSLQRICGRRYDPEYLMHPVEPFRKGGQIDMVVVRLDYNLERVNEHLSNLLYEINEQKRQEFPEADVVQLLADYDNLLDEVKREVPTFIPNL